MLRAPDATGIKEDSLNNNKQKQLYYKVARPYPVLAVGNESFKKLATLGWKACASSSNGWVSYVDAADMKNVQCIYKAHTRFFTKGKKLLVFSARYLSPVGANRTCPDAPNNAVQMVFVEIYDQDTEGFCQSSK